MNRHAGNQLLTRTPARRFGYAASRPPPRAWNVWNKTPSRELNRVRALPSTMHDHELTKERREREKAEVLKRFRSFAKRSTWKKSQVSRELGVSLSTVDRWLDGHDKIMLASMLEIRRFLAERERGSLSGQKYL
jgi:Homeodomain-like domain